MTICFFGSYIRDYPRIVVLQKGLRQNDVQILECHTRETGLRKYLDLYRQHRKVSGKYDYLLVGMGGYTLVWFARLLTRKPVVFDVFVSLYLTNVEDRKNCQPGSLKAWYYAFWDRFSCYMADKILLDTNAQIDYFVQKYKLNKDKFIRVLVGTDPDIFYPMSSYKSKDSRFLVHWHGHIVPFHGLEAVIEAAELLKDETDIEFQIVTRFNSKYEKIKQEVERMKLTNVKFYPESTYKELAEFINRADVCLGVFGRNQKAQVVVPNKIFEAIACAKPVITAESAAVSELFEDGFNVIITKPGNSSGNSNEISQKIINLHRSHSKVLEIGSNAYKLFQNELTPKQVSQNLVKVLKI